MKVILKGFSTFQMAILIWFSIRCDGVKRHVEKKGFWKQIEKLEEGGGAGGRGRRKEKKKWIDVRFQLLNI